MSIVHIAFYPSDWLAGTRGLSAEETGVYITLVCRMYEMAGPVERDDDRLHRLCGTKSKKAFVKCLEHLISEGKLIESGGELFNERAQKEIEITTNKSSKAKTAAQSRWNRKSNKNNGGQSADASPKHMPQRCQSEPESEPLKRDTIVSPKKTDQEEAFQFFNETAKRVGWPIVQLLSEPRKKAVSARIADVDGLENWKRAIERASASPHLTGQNDRGWKASFDWLSKQSNFIKLMEGNYDPRTPAKSRPFQRAFELRGLAGGPDRDPSRALPAAAGAGRGGGGDG